MNGSELERAVIAGALYRPDILATVPLHADDFADPFLGKAWIAARDMHLAGKPTDAVTVGDAMGGDAIFKLGTISNDYAHTASSIAHTSGVLKQKGLERRAARIATDFAEGRIDKSQLLSGLRALDLERELPAKTAYSTLAELIDMLDNPPPAIPTGLAKVDDNFSGFHKGDLVMLVARPAIGKTAMAITLGRNMAKANHPILFYSGEMPAHQVTGRLCALEANVPAYKFRSGKLSEEEWEKFSAAGSRLADVPFNIADAPIPKLQDIVATANRVKESEKGLDVLFVDYAQRIVVPRCESKRHEQIEIARTMKGLARELDICVVLLAQAGRQVDDRELMSYGRLPGLSDIQESAAYEQETDLALMLARNEALGALAVEKNRHGPTGMCLLSFNGPTMEFTDAQATQGKAQVTVG